MSCLIKICGLSEESTLRVAIEAGADMVGFVHFEKSPRHVSLERAAELKSFVPAHVATVMVLVDPDDALLAEIAQKVAPTFLQLHGSESPERVMGIRGTHPTQKVIKALSLSTKADLDAARDYEPFCDALMFDAKPPAGADLQGGNGIAFDWNILRGFESIRPWLLSGGLTAENVKTALTQSGAQAVDVSSGVESKPGVKDADKIKRFIQEARKSA